MTSPSRRAPPVITFDHVTKGVSRPAQPTRSVGYLAADLRRRVHLPGGSFGLGQVHLHPHAHPRGEADAGAISTSRARTSRRCATGACRTCAATSAACSRTSAAAEQDRLRERRVRAGGHRQEPPCHQDAGPPRSCAWSACRRSSTRCPTSSPAASSSASPSRAPSSTGPPLLVCDEPTGNLDPQTSRGIMDLLERINRTGHHGAGRHARPRDGRQHAPSRHRARSRPADARPGQGGVRFRCLVCSTSSANRSRASRGIFPLPWAPSSRSSCRFSSSASSWWAATWSTTSSRPVENEVSITAYVSDEASQSDIDKVMDWLESQESVASVGFTTKEQALQNFQATSSDIVDALDGSNPLPASIDVELSDPPDGRAGCQRPGVQLDVRPDLRHGGRSFRRRALRASRRSSVCSR